MQNGRPGSIVAATAFTLACWPLSVGKFAAALLALLVYHGTFTAKADSCPSAKDEIATDRPDVINSSLVVPAGSLQIENGLNFSARDGGRFIDGTNTRLRAGIANCLEFLVDVPTYFANVRGPEGSGFSDVVPALKWQTERASLFVEYVADYLENGSPAELLNSGGLYRLSPNQQLDFHVALGLNRNAPSYIVGVGYSVRFDGLFPLKRSSASIAPHN